MKCSYPMYYRTRDGMKMHPCGQCMKCRITKRQEWTLRLLLEARCVKYVWFITLTYDDNHVPNGCCVACKNAFKKTIIHKDSLCKADTRNYLKRLRKRLKKPYRYYIVGEYGEKTYRPHYHLLLFTDENIEIGNYEKLGRGNRSRYSYPDSPFTKAWPYGFVDISAAIDEKSRQSIISYVCGYVVKKLTNPKNMKEIFGENNQKVPEFATMSRKPGIGFNIITSIVERLRKYRTLPEWIELSGDSGKQYEFYAIRYNGKVWPVSRTFRERIISELGGDKRTDLFKGLLLSAKATKRMMRDVETAEADEKEREGAEVRAQKRSRISKNRRPI